MRSLSLLALSLVGLALLCATTAHAAIIANGERCGNQDTCEPGNVCYFNTCISDIFQGEMPSGQGNECSATDCCTQQFNCYNIGAVIDQFGQIPQDPNNPDQPTITSICLMVTADEAGSLPIIPCGGQQPTDPTPTDPTPTDPTPTDPTPTDPTPTDPTPTDPTPTDPTPTDPTPTDPTPTDPTPTDPTPTDPTPTDPIPIEPSTSTGPNQGGSDNPNTPTPTDPTPSNPTDGSCGNAAACPNGDFCLANRCVSAAIAGPLAINALGNTCSASDCCPLGLMCTQEGNRCAPQVASIASVTCAATGGVNSGVRVGPQGSGNPNTGGQGTPQGGNAAAGVQVTGGVVAMLLAAGVAATMRAW